MSLRNIYFFTGYSEQSKVQEINKWIKNRKSVDGILVNSKIKEKYFLHISSGDKKYLQEEDAYKWAGIRLLESLKNNPSWLIIDEISLLEFRGEGFDSVIPELIRKVKQIDTLYLLFIIPEHLIEMFISHYHLEYKTGKVILNLSKIKHG